MRTLISSITAALVCVSAHAALAQEPPPAPAGDTATPAPAATPAPETTATVEAPSASKPWMFGLAPRVGLTVPTSKLGAFVVGGLEINIATPVAAHRLVVMLDASYTRPSYSSSVMDGRIPGGMASYTIKEDELKLSAGAIYRLFGSEHKLIPFFGAAVVWHMLRSNETNGIAPGTNTSQSDHPGFELMGGADLELGPGYAVGELRFPYSRLRHYLAGSTNAGNIELSLGYRIVF